MNNNTLPLVAFEQAKRLKAAGFDWPTEHYYICGIDTSLRTERYCQNNGNENYNSPEMFRRPSLASDLCPTISAPSVALALKWMRDVRGALHDMEFGGGLGSHSLEWSAYIGNNSVDEVINTGWRNSYEAAESALLDALLTLFENEK